MRCPHCGEDRLIEFDGRRWFCAVCGRTWSVGGQGRGGHAARTRTVAVSEVLAGAQRLPVQHATQRMPVPSLPEAPEAGGTQKGSGR